LNSTVVADGLRAAFASAASAQHERVTLLGGTEGKLRGHGKGEASAQALRVPAHAPLSGRATSFSAGAKCGAGS
jgi:hypothetical protein